MPATATRSFPDARSLRQHFAVLRRQLLRVTWLRGVTVVLALLLPAVLVAGMLDWFLHLPGVVRAVLLTGILTGSAILAYRFLYLPLGRRVDDLTLALRIEEYYPSLNDSLASTIEFLNQAEQGVPGESPALRREAVRRALASAASCDFQRVVDRRGLLGSSLAALAAANLVWPLFLFVPALASTGLVRLLNPFGTTSWPKKTQIELETPRTKVGKGEVFEIRGVVRGVVPEQARVSFRSDGFPPLEYRCDLKREGDREGRLVTQLDPDKVQRTFWFRVMANDAETVEYKVEVLPPPRLVPFKGEESPQVELEFPEYTNLPARIKLTPGTGNVEAVLGTVVHFRAAADRPLQRASIEFIPEQRTTQLAGFLAPLGATSRFGAEILAQIGQSTWEQVPATLSEEERVLSVSFRPWLNGFYDLHYEDHNGLRSSRRFELRLRPDPAPTVTLERPSPSRDLLRVLPTGEVFLQASAEDVQFAVRSVSLRYRTRKGNGVGPAPAEVAGAAAETQVMPLYDPIGVRACGLPLAAGPATVAWTTLKLRPTRVDVQRMLSLKTIRHPDGESLREGDVVILQVIADDYDDVTYDKQPGASHEVEIRIVGSNALDLALNQEQAAIQQELLKLREKEREAIQKVQEAEKRLKRGEKLSAEEQEQLSEAEQIQQQIHERIGNEEKGLRAQIARIQETLRQNGMQNSPVRERMADVGRELARLEEKELEQIESRLSGARKQSERQAQLEERATEQEKQARLEEETADKKKAGAAEAEAQKEKAPSRQEQARLETEAQRQRQLAESAQQRAEELRQQAARDRQEAGQQSPRQQLTEARQHQEEVEKTLNDLLQRLEPWSSAREIKGEAKQLLQDQKQLQAQVEQLKDQVKLGTKKDDLTERQRAELDTLKEQQQRLEERTNQLLEKMDRLARDRAEKDPETARELRQAQEEAMKENIPAQMKEAKEKIQQNQLGEAQESQRESIRGLEKLVRNLEDRREAELERLAKKLKEAQKRLEELKDQQEKLNKKVKEAQQKNDTEELKRLAREQEQLQHQTQEMVKQLSRLRAERASQALGKAGGQMEQAGQQMQQGMNPEEPQEALDRLDEARREVERARRQAEEELQREQLIRVAETIQRLKERQEALSAEGGRIQNEVQRNGDWSRGLLGSLRGLGESEAGLGSETEEVGRKDLPDTPVFARMLRRAGEAMTEVQGRTKQMIADRPEAKALPDPQLTRLQQQALRRLTQVLEAVKEQARGNQSGGQAGGGGGGQPGGGEGGDGGGGSQGDTGLPPPAQLKLLRTLQVEVNQATEEFRKQHPNADKLTESEKTELQSLSKQQQDIIELLEELRRPADEPGEKEGEKK